MPQLHLICGMSGSGKTTYAKKLEQSTNAIHLSGDNWISTIIDNKSDIKELDRLRDPIEKILWNLATKLLSKGVGVILDNGFWSKEERMLYFNAAKAIDPNTKILLYYIDTPKNLLLERIKSRNESLPNDCFHINTEELESWLMLFEHPSDDESELDDYFEIIKP